MHELVRVLRSGSFGPPRRWVASCLRWSLRLRSQSQMATNSNGQLSHSESIVSTYRGTDGLISRVVPHGEIRMVQSLFTCDTLGRIEVKQLRQQIDSERVGSREQLWEGHPRLDRERTNVILGLRSKPCQSSCSSLLNMNSHGENRLDARYPQKEYRDSVRFDSIDQRNWSMKWVSFTISKENGTTNSLPLNIGLPASNSAKIHPTDQTSMAGP